METGYGYDVQQLTISPMHFHPVMINGMRLYFHKFNRTRGNQKGSQMQKVLNYQCTFSTFIAFTFNYK